MDFLEGYRCFLNFSFMAARVDMLTGPVAAFPPLNDSR
jgi:hypothetical protein